MKPKFKLILLHAAAFIFCFSTGFGQFDRVLKGGGKLLDKSPSKLMEKYFSNAPITTHFEDAKTEVMLLGNFDPNVYMPSPVAAYGMRPAAKRNTLRYPYD